jgi:predicted dehydrogenase
LKIIKWGIVGTGSIASSFADDIRLIDNCEVIAVTSRKKESGEKFAEKYKIEEVYTDYTDMLANKAIDCIYVATPHSLHKNNSIQAMKAGKAVLCEKPISLSPEDTKEMLKYSKNRKILFMEALWSKFIPAVEKLLELLEEKVIGDIKFVKADFGIDIGEDYPPEARLLNPELGGGALYDVGIYPISFANFIFKEKPVNIQTTMLPGSTGVDALSTYTFQYKNGSYAVLFGTITARPENNLFIRGAKGCINMPNFWQGDKFTIKFDNGRKESHHFPKLGHGYTHEIKSFVKSYEKKAYQNEIMNHAESLRINEIMADIYANFKNN